MENPFEPSDDIYIISVGSIQVDLRDVSKVTRTAKGDFRLRIGKKTITAYEKDLDQDAHTLLLDCLEASL